MFDMRHGFSSRFELKRGFTNQKFVSKNPETPYIYIVVVLKLSSRIKIAGKREESLWKQEKRVPILTWISIKFFKANSEILVPDVYMIRISYLLDLKI